MPTTDPEGRPYARLSELKVGDRVLLDSDFLCHQPGQVTIEEDEKGLYFLCNEGLHYLDGQTDDGEYLIGIYPLPEVPSQ